MYKLLNTQKRFTSSFYAQLQSTSVRLSSNYYGDLNSFKFAEKDFKVLTPVETFIEKYRNHGHHYTQLDPLGLKQQY